jgi:hypothetical protein
MDACSVAQKAAATRHAATGKRFILNNYSGRVLTDSVYVGTMRFSHDWMGDTHPDALRAWVKIQSEIPPERKLQMVAEMYDAMEALQTAEVRRLYPEADDREVFLRVTARRLGPELMKKAYGWVQDS